MSSDNRQESVYAALPPHALVLLAIITIQLGAALATTLFSVLGAEGTAAIRIVISAVLLFFATRSTSAVLFAAFRQHSLMLMMFGACVAAMNLFFYMAIERIPLGAAVAIEFTGPLGVAAFTSKRKLHLLWVALAAVGVFLLSPFSGVDLDPVGIVLAMFSGAGWALFMIMSSRISSRVSGNDGLAIGMIVAGFLLMPIALPVIPELVSSPMVLISVLGVAVLSTTVPFTLEFEALKRLSTSAYGILVSAEPAFAALAGALLLGDRIGVQGIVAVACIIVAAIGISLTGDRKTTE